MEFRGIADIPNVPMQITPPSPYGGSITFPGGAGGNYPAAIGIPNGTDFSFGTGDFTIEYYYKWTSDPSSLVGSISLLSIGAAASQNGYTWAVKMGYSPTARMNVMSGGFVGGTTLLAGVGLGVGTWYHLALVRESGVIKGYLNGVLDAARTWSNSTDITAYTANLNFTIGREQAKDGFYYSAIPAPLRITNVRIVKGTAVYTGNFTPSSTPLTAVSGTKLLLLATAVNTLLVDSSGSGNNGSNPSGQYAGYATAATYNADSPFPFTV
jgi:hypothetical protein